MAKATGLNENENRPWTPESDHQLRTLLMMGTPTALVAQVFKRSRRGIMARLQREHREWWLASGHREAVLPAAEIDAESPRHLTRLATVEKKIDNLTAMMHRLLTELTGKATP